MTDYDILREKYWSGTTSQAEEQQLLQMIQAQAHRTQDDEVLLVMLQGAIELAGERQTITQPRKHSSHRLWISIASMAAALTIALWVGAPQQETPLGYSNGKVISSQEEALALVETAWQEIAYDPSNEMEW